MLVDRKTRVSVVVAGFVASLIAGAGHRTIVRADGPPGGLTPDEMIAGMKAGFEKIGGRLGGFTADEKTKLADFETKLADQMKADPKKAQSKEFEDSSIKDFEEILAPEHKTAFEQLMKDEKAKAKTASNLVRPGMSVWRYSEENDAKFPADLGVLASQPEVMAELFLTADSKTTGPADWKTMDAKGKAEWVNKNTDFVYVAGGKTHRDLPGNFVVAYVKPELAPAGNSFLMGDLHVESHSPDESTAILADLKDGKNPPPSLK